MADKDLKIIITTSFQNDFIEPLDDLLNSQIGDNLKLDFEKCSQMWLEYFMEQEIDVQASNVNQFIKWLKSNATSQNINIPVSYHRILEKYKHRVHIDYDETKRLWEGEKVNQFIKDSMNKANKAFENENSNEEYQFIHLRDWHDQTDITQKEELDLFGLHCLKGTYGAKFVSPLNELIEKYHEFNIVINSNTLSSFAETNLEFVLNTIIKNAGSSKKDIKIGIFGVITNVKIFLFVFELIVIHKFKHVYVCGDFCAGFNRQGHLVGTNNITNILGASVVSHQKFREIFNI
ncbi:MAG: hypothetical protein ACTSRI_18690 [Promethearchaeota archaeon]